MITTLGPGGTPGKVYSFSPKGSPADQITRLSPQATPGNLYEFLPKQPAPIGKPQITCLHPTGTPGKCYEFLPKEPVGQAAPAGNAGVWINQYQDDEDIMAIIYSFLRMRG